MGGGRGAKSLTLRENASTILNDRAWLPQSERAPATTTVGNYGHRLVEKDGPIAINNWLHGHTIYYALTAKAINYWGDLAKPYPSCEDIRLQILAAGRQNPANNWVLDYVDDIISLLHPDPNLRGDAAVVAKRIRELRPSVAHIAEWASPRP